jgi:flagellar biosynthetic protein FlhB
MAENADGQEKTESPSDKKLSEAREKGQVPRSKELGTLLIMLLSALWFMWLGPSMIDDFVKTTSAGLSFDRDHVFDIKKASDLVFAQLNAALWMVMPFMIAMLMMAVLSNILVGGWLFSTEVMSPKFSKLNPISGIKRMFSLNSLIELFKALLKFMLMSAIAVLFIYSTLHELRLLGTVEFMLGIASAGDLLVRAFLIMTLGLIVIALIDAPYQLWKNAEDMKMTMQEVKDEYKQSEGNPEIKGRIRRMQREMAQRRMMKDVPNADVIITNPEHYAVALQYDAESGDSAPKILAMGVDFMAAQIRSIAQENKIQIVRSPALARALYYNGDIGSVIPTSLFRAVAEILAVVYQLRAKQISKLPDFSNVAVPPDLKQSPS